MSGKKLYVGNLSYKTTDDALRQFFEAGGRQVTDVFIVSDRATGQSRGFAFVEMGSPAEAQAAIEALNGAQLDGRALKVSEARERTNEGPRGGGGPGGRGDFGGRGGGRGDFGNRGDFGGGGRGPRR